MAFKRARMRLTLTRWDKQGKAVIKILLLLNPITVQHFESIISRKKMGTEVNFQIDDLEIARAELQGGNWKLYSSMPWLRPEDGSWNLGNFDSLQKVVEHLLDQAEKADGPVFWPAVLTRGGWRLSRSFKLKEQEPFASQEAALEFLRQERLYDTTYAYPGSRLSPGKELLKETR